MIACCHGVALVFIMFSDLQSYEMEVFQIAFGLRRAIVYLSIAPFWKLLG
jgi:hypothetical protein